MTSREVYEKNEGFYEKARQNPKVWVGLGILLAVILLIWLPPWRVSHFGINNATVEADLENQYRATLAQILGGGAVLVGIYFAWKNFKLAQATLKHNQEASQKNLEIALATLESNMKISQDNLKIAQEGLITERFTRAVDQLGSDKMEIRLGGIYALERVSKESKENYWPIMDILTSYIRKNSSFEMVGNKNVSSDVQAVLSVIARREFSFKDIEPSPLNLRDTCLRGADLSSAHLEGSNLKGVHLEGAELLETYLEEADLSGAHLEEADLFNAFLEGAELMEAHLEKACLTGAHLGGTNLSGAHLEDAELNMADLSSANLFAAKLCATSFQEANLKGAKSLTCDQLSIVKTLYNAKLDPELEKPLMEKYPALFEKPDEL